MYVLNKGGNIGCRESAKSIAEGTGRASTDQLNVTAKKLSAKYDTLNLQHGLPRVVILGPKTPTCMIIMELILTN